MTEEATGATDVAQPGAEVETPAPASSWTAALPDELRQVAELKGWQDPAAVVDSYRNLEKLRGVPAERLLTLPEDGADMGPVWDKLGRPEAPEKYTNALGDTYADDTFKAAASKAHELGLNDKQFAGMQEWLRDTTAAIEGKRREEIDGAFTDWSEANPAAVQNVQRMLGAVGAKAEEVDAALSGDKARLFDVLSRVAARMSEGRVVDGEPSNGVGMSKAAALQKRSALFGDKDFMARYQSHDARIRSSAVSEMERLNKIIAGEAS